MTGNKGEQIFHENNYSLEVCLCVKKNYNFIFHFFHYCLYGYMNTIKFKGEVGSIKLYNNTWM